MRFFIFWIFFLTLPGVVMASPFTYNAAQQAFQAGDIAKAIELHQGAAANHYTPSEYMLGYIYKYYRAAPTDTYAALYWLKRAAAKNYTAAQYELASYYYKGRGVKQNVPAAITYLERAARKGYQPAVQALINIKGRPVSHWRAPFYPAPKNQWPARPVPNRHNG